MRTIPLTTGIWSKLLLAKLRALNLSQKWIQQSTQIRQSLTTFRQSTRTSIGFQTLQNSLQKCPPIEGLSHTLIHNALRFFMIKFLEKKNFIKYTNKRWKIKSNFKKVLRIWKILWDLPCKTSIRTTWYRNKKRLSNRRNKVLYYKRKS